MKQIKIGRLVIKFSIELKKKRASKKKTLS